MPIKSRFQPYSLTKKQTARQVFKVNQFLGLNTNKDQLIIGDSQATEMMNLIYKDGVIQKRTPFIQVSEPEFSIENGGDYFLYQINGIYQLDNYLIFHIYKNLFIAHIDSIDSDILNTYFEVIENSSLENNKSCGFVDKHRLYILDGTTYWVLYREGYTWKLEEVYNHKDTFVPVTSITTEASSGIKGGILDDVNMLTSYRKNILRTDSIIEKEGSEVEYVFNLDSQIADINNVTFEIRNNNIDYRDLKDCFDLLGIEATYDSETDTLSIPDGEYSDGELNITLEPINELSVEDGKIYAVVIEDNEETTVEVGYIEVGVGEVAKIAFNNVGFIPSLKALKEVIVKFESTNNNNKIDSCTFGTIYNEQLFLSGNSAFQNQDFHSEPINTTYLTEEEAATISKFTYFSDLNYCAYGTDDTAIIGYDTYRDGDLIVFKEEKNNNATLYRRTKELKQAIDMSGETISGQYEYFYPMYEINGFGGEGALSHDCIANLAGSTIYLTKNGLKLLTSKETTYNNARYSYNMSSNIKQVLEGKIKTLSGVRLFVFKEKVFLFTRNEAYYADYNVKNENELEWFPIDLSFCYTRYNHIHTMFEYKDKIYFVSDALYVFEPSEVYKDRKITLVNVTSIEDGIVTWAQEDIPVEVGQKVYFFKPHTNLYIKQITYNDQYQEVTNYVKVKRDDEFEYVGSGVFQYCGVNVDGFYENNGTPITTGIKMLIYYDKPINAHFITKPFNMGSSMYEKTVWGYSIVNDSGLKSQTFLSYLANRKESDVVRQISSNSVDLSKYSFESISYENDGLPHLYTRYRPIPRVSFIKFTFYNDNTSNMVLSELDILYSVSQLTRGIK